MDVKAEDTTEGLDDPNPSVTDKGTEVNTEENSKIEESPKDVSNIKDLFTWMRTLWRL